MTDPIFLAPKITPAGEDLSTLVNDPNSSVTDRRTPEAFAGVDRLLAGQMGVGTDELRLIKGAVTAQGMVSLWEILDPDLKTVEGHVVASYDEGSVRFRLTRARLAKFAEERYYGALALHGVAA